MQARKIAKSDSPPFQFSLRIRHPSMDPDDLSREFNMEAEHSFRAGDPRPVRSGVAPASVRTESYWLGALNAAELAPDISFPGRPKLQHAAEHLQVTAANSFGWALSLSAAGFFRRHADLLRRLQSEGGEITLLVALSASEVRNFSLAPGVSHVFGECGVTVEFELTDD